MSEKPNKKSPDPVLADEIQGLYKKKTEPMAASDFRPAGGCKSLEELETQTYREIDEIRAVVASLAQSIMSNSQTIGRMLTHLDVVRKERLAAVTRSGPKKKRRK